VSRVTQVLECQVGEATEGMSEQEADTYLAEVFGEAHARENVAAQDILAERGYDYGWKELQECSWEKEQDLIRSPKVPFSD
jgi:predicted metal-dependent peptidase